MLKHFGTFLALALLCGCFKVKDELTLEPDGSGVVRMETQTTLPPEMLTGMFGGGRDEAPVLYPPVTESEARRFFGEKDFKLTAKQSRGQDGAITLTLEARFTNVNALLNSAYGKAHALVIEKTNQTLRVRALTAVEGAARLAEMKDETGMMRMGALGDMEKQKAEMRVEFRLTLPGDVIASNGERSGKWTAWIFERAKFKDGAEFADKAGTLLEATCSAEKVTFQPVSPMRLALQPFATLRAGTSGEKGSAVEAKKITEAARFIPYAVRVTRSLDLTGEGSSGENSAMLIGAVVLPREFTPQRWGEPKLIEALDAKGNNLKPEGNRVRHLSRFSAGGNVDEDSPGAEKPPEKEVRRVVTLGFQPPDWRTKEIAKIRGSVLLHYAGGATEIVKLTNAVPAKAIMDMKSGGLNFESDERAIANPDLAELGLKLSVQNAMKQSGMLVVMLSVQGTRSSILEAQAFDAAGRPWPTFLQPMESGSDEQRTLTLVVAGQPTAPLSLALQVSGGGEAVEIPILVEKVPLQKKEVK